MKVLFFRMDRHIENIRGEIFSAIDKVFISNKFILGKEVLEFEKKISEILNIKYCVGVSSGTDALLISLMALEIKQGDEVITTPYTFFATCGAILRTGAKPCFVDIEEHSFNINPERIENAINEKTKAILPVHLFGRIGDMNKIITIAKKYKIFVIEDACQAIKAEMNGKSAGGIGDIGAFSFFPSKNLGAFGDAGMVSTNSFELYQKIKSLRNHGQKEAKFFHFFIGGNFRIDEIQAAILNIKIKYLNEWIKKRREIANRYTEMFSSSGIVNEFIKLPKEGENSLHVYNQYVLWVKKRDELKEYLYKQGIETNIYYPLPLHLQPALLYLGYKEGDFPVAERASKETLAIPIYPELKQEEQEYVVKAITEFYRKERV